MDAQQPETKPDPVIVEPLPLDDAPAVVTNAEYTADLVERADKRAVLTTASTVRDNAIHTWLDEIDVASSIPGGDVRIRILTKKIRDSL